MSAALSENRPESTASGGPQPVVEVRGVTKYYDGGIHALDAVDLDFCTGTFRGNRVHRSGGDGLDLSGSTLTVERNLITSPGDKGISVGERSRATLRDNVILEGVTGIAVKDDSDVEISDSALVDLDAGIAAYVKKPTYGPGRTSVA